MAAIPKTSKIRVTTKNPKNIEPALMGFFIDEITDMYSAKKRFVKTLPKMMNEVSSNEFQIEVGKHLEANRQQVSRLEQVFELGKKVQVKKSNAIVPLSTKRHEFVEDIVPKIPNTFVCFSHLRWDFVF